MKDIIIRAIKTFVQAAIGYICTISFMDLDWNNSRVIAGVLISACAAGISALMNVDWISVAENKDTDEDDDLDEEQLIKEVDEEGIQYLPDATSTSVG